MSFLKRSSTHSAQQSFTDRPARSEINLALRKANDSSRDTRCHRGSRSLQYPSDRTSWQRRSGCGMPSDGSSQQSTPTQSMQSRKWAPIFASLKVFQVIGDVTHDDVLEDGLIVQSNSKVDMLAAKPDRMRVEVTSR